MLPPEPSLLCQRPIEEGSRNTEQLFESESNNLDNDCDQMFETGGGEHDNVGDDLSAVDSQNGAYESKDYPPPVVGMEFESYDDAYNYYNSYSKEVGFGIRVKSSWTKRNSKEKRGAVLCCNCEGFKTVKEANIRRKETRTGCLAMVRLRLVESNRWRIDEAKLEHNHLIDYTRAQNSKSHKKMDAGAKRKVEPPLDIEVRTIKLYKGPFVDSSGYGNSNANEGEQNSLVDRSMRLKLEKGDARVIHDYFSRVQLTCPNFFYSMDLSEEGFLKNVFWTESRSKAAYGHFGDVILFDTSCLSNRYEIPLFAFVGVNHHGESILLGCGLLADKSVETYTWLLRAWLTYMSGRAPQTIITDRNKALQIAVQEVFPRAHHRLSLSCIVKSIPENFGDLEKFEAFKMVFNRVVYDSLKVDEFEVAWEDMLEQFGLKNHEWLSSLYEERERWVPAFSKDTFFAGMSTFRLGESLCPFFDGYVHEKTSLKEFFDLYELVVQKKIQKEASDDFESSESPLLVRTSCHYELQLSKIYTKRISRKFQHEVEMMSSCLGITQVHANGLLVTYIVKEHAREGTSPRVGNYEVTYDKGGMEVRCICGCFNFEGYLCRHALCVLNYNRVEEIPSQYVLSRWRKDPKRLYSPDFGLGNVDITNPLQWFDHLHRRAMQVVEEGMISQDHYMVAWQAFKESLNKVRLAGEKHV